MKLRYILPLTLLLATVTGIYAKSGLFKRKENLVSATKIYVSMASPNHLDGVRAFDTFTGAYINAKYNADQLWELHLDPTHRYQIEGLYDNKQGNFNSLSFAGAISKIKSIEGKNWYRMTSKSTQFSNGSNYVLYSCQGTDCFE